MVDYGLASIGIPPTLPNFDELADMGVDYLATVAMEQAGGAGLACPLTPRATANKTNPDRGAFARARRMRDMMYRQKR